MTASLKAQQEYLQNAAVDIRRTFCRPVYFHCEGIDILLGHFWKYPHAEFIWRKAIEAIRDLQKEIARREGRL